ncbi:MAG TPA: hypothetical protein VEL76_36110 [Gemmataceae bacterium]|nr:hypothetical protein [Gemmataceae bacterium]
MIKLKCPSCARPLGIDEAYVGMQALCPGCGATFTVPAPAVLLEQPPPPAPVPPPFPSEPVLPEGPVGLVAETMPTLAPTAPRADPTDPWAQTEVRGRSSPAQAPAVAQAPAAPATSPAPGSSLILDIDLLPLEPSPPLPPQEGNRAMTDWRYLALEEDQVPPAPPPPATSQEQSAAPAPPVSAADAPVPLLLPPPMAADNVLLPVSLADAGSYDMRPPPLPADAAPMLPPPADAVSKEPLVPIVTVTPVAGPVPGAGHGTIKKRKTRQGAQLIPGLDSFYFGLIGLGVVWLVLLVLMLRAPSLFLVPITVGMLVWGAGGMKVRPRVAGDDGDWWLTLAFLPLAVFVYPIVQRKSVGPLVVLLVGLLFVLTGVVGLARDFSEPPGLPIPGMQGPP